MEPGAEPKVAAGGNADVKEEKLDQPAPDMKRKAENEAPADETPPPSGKPRVEGLGGQDLDDLRNLVTRLVSDVVAQCTKKNVKIMMPEEHGCSLSKLKDSFKGEEGRKPCGFSTTMQEAAAQGMSQYTPIRAPQLLLPTSFMHMLITVTANPGATGSDACKSRMHAEHRARHHRRRQAPTPGSALAFHPVFTHLRSTYA